MTKSVVIVHDDPGFIEAITLPLQRSGHVVVLFADPMEALEALDEKAIPADVLITRTQFPAGKPNGIALARMMRVKRPDLKLLITGKEHLAEFASGVADFLPHPIDFTALTAAVDRLLNEHGEPRGQSAA